MIVRRWITSFSDWFHRSNHSKLLMPKSKPRRCSWKSEMFIVVLIMSQWCWTSKCVPLPVSRMPNQTLPTGIKTYKMPYK